MTLVERFIEVNRWSAARKTVWLAGATLAVNPVALGASHWLLPATGAVRWEIIDAIYAAAAVASALCLGASLVAVRRGSSSAWPGYLFVVCYGLPVSCMLFALGTWSSPMFTLWVEGVMLAALVYGVRVAGFALVAGLALIAGFTGLHAAGLLGYAPAVIERNFDVHATLAWSLALMFPIGITTGIAFLLTILIVSARDLQDGRLARAQALIRRYVPSQLADRIMRGEHSTAFRPERVKLTIFFSDIEGFTDASDKLDAEDLAAILNEYLSEMSDIAERHGATVNQFVGDGIMIFFGAPHATSDADHALRAVRMAMDMQRRMAELHGLWTRRGIGRPFRIRIGINTGHASVGDFGSEARKVYSAIGVQTNVAARIQARCEPGRILISASTWGLVHDQVPCVDKGEIPVKGLHYPVRVYEVAEAASGRSDPAAAG